MAVQTYNLGTVTAYGDAKAGGYTGTLTEWQTLMANYATVGQQATQSAQTATTKASEASASATQAVNAKTAAETAQSGAESAASSVSASASQIAQNTADITELKEDLNEVIQPVESEGFVSIYDFTQGNPPSDINVINGYIRPTSGSYPGRISSASGKYVFWFQADHEMAIYLTSNGYGNTYSVRLRISDEQPVTGNSKPFTGDVYENAGTATGTLPTEETPLTVPQGKYIAFCSTNEWEGVQFTLYEYQDTTKYGLADDVELSAAQKAYVDSAVADVATEVDGVEFKADSAFNKTYDLPLTWSDGYFPSAVGNRIDASLSSNSAYKSGPVFNLTYPVLIGNDRVYQIRICKADAETMLITEQGSFGAGNIECVSANVPFRFTIQRTDGEAITSDTDEDINAHVTVTVLMPNGVLPVKWLAMGDSITQGWYSYSGGNDTDATKTWLGKVAKANGWEVTNRGWGGTGWLNEADGSTISSAWYRAKNVIDFTPYNLVTLAYGINDWKGNMQMGDMTDDPTATTCTTVIQAMRSTIESIISKNPACKIIVITPLNCKGYTGAYGDESTNYGIGYRFANTGTLEEFVTKMIEVCDYYGIQYIDMTHYSPINRKSLPLLLPDGVHPSQDCHTLLAHELSKKITF